MKQIYLMLVIVCCAQSMEAMQPDVKMRDGISRAELEEREILRVEIKRAYDILRRDIHAYDALPIMQQQATKKAYLSAVHERLDDIEYLESLATERDASAAARHMDFMTKFKDELESGVRIESFEAVAQTSMIARLGWEQRRQLIREHLAAQARVAAEADAVDADPENDEIDEVNRDGDGFGITNDDIFEAGFAVLVGKASWMLVRQGGKWALKGANPWIAGALTAAEIYKLGCYLKTRNNKS